MMEHLLQIYKKNRNQSLNKMLAKTTKAPEERNLYSSSNYIFFKRCRCEILKLFCQTFSLRFDTKRLRSSGADL